MKLKYAKRNERSSGSMIMRLSIINPANEGCITKCLEIIYNRSTKVENILYHDMSATKIPQYTDFTNTSTAIILLRLYHEGL